MLIQGQLITRLAAAAAILVVIVAACTLETPTIVEPPDTPVPTDTAVPTETPLPPIVDPVLPLYEPAGPGGMGALLSGVLVVEGHCLFVQGQSGSNVLPVFPAGSVSWEGDKLILRGQMFGIGHRVSMGGGEVPYTSNMRFLQPPHESCDVEEVWIAYLGE